MKSPLTQVQALCLVILCCVISPSICADLSLNQTAISVCTETNPCWLQDPEIWINNTIPATNDSITLGNIPGTCIFLNSSLTLNDLLINDVSLILQGLSFLTVGSAMLMGPAASLILEGHATMVSTQRYVSLHFPSSDSFHLSISYSTICPLNVSFALLFLYSRGYCCFHYHLSFSFFLLPKYPRFSF